MNEPMEGCRGLWDGWLPLETYPITTRLFSIHPAHPPTHPPTHPQQTGAHIMFDNTGNKYGACGPFSGMYGMNGVTVLKPGPLTLTWEESIAHVGSPFRLAILDENEEVKVRPSSSSSSSHPPTYHPPIQVKQRHQNPTVQQQLIQPTHPPLPQQQVVLADHIPHDDDAKSSFVERTYTPYHLTVEIPDVKCDKVHLLSLPPTHRPIIHE